VRFEEVNAEVAESAEGEQTYHRGHREHREGKREFGGIDLFSLFSL
jgi:hypothetical protein